MYPAYFTVAAGTDDNAMLVDETSMFPRLTRTVTGSGHHRSTVDKAGLSLFNHAPLEAQRQQPETATRR